MSRETDEATSVAQLNRERYHQAYVMFREWNEADLRAETLDTRLRLIAEMWRQYLAVAEQAWERCSSSEDWYRLEKIYDLDHYYARLLRFERQRGYRKPSSQTSRVSQLTN